MSESFLITRPESQNAQIAKFLDQRGYEVILEPILDIEIVKYDESHIKKIKEKPIQAVLITSFNASETFLSFNFDKDVEIFAIGEKTIQKIRESGYQNIFLPEKSNILELEKLFLQKVKAQNGQILYFCGDCLTKDLQLSFVKCNIGVENILSYKAQYHEDFSPDFLKITKQKKIDNILCYSKNNVQNLARLLKKHDYLDYFTNVKRGKK